MPPLKDELLSRLAEHANVAQFISFGPHPELPQRHARLRGHRPDHRFATPEDAVDGLLAAAGGSVNVRSFKAGAGGGPFTYGLTRRDDVLAGVALGREAGGGLVGDAQALGVLAAQHVRAGQFGRELGVLTRLHQVVVLGPRRLEECDHLGDAPGVLVHDRGSVRACGGREPTIPAGGTA